MPDPNEKIEKLVKYVIEHSSMQSRFQYPDPQFEILTEYVLDGIVEILLEGTRDGSAGALVSQWVDQAIDERIAKKNSQR